MQRLTCPFLGTQEDPGTALNFPSEGNFCHRASPVEPIRTEHQERFCLTPGFTGCPVYQAAQPVPLPAEIAVPAYRQASRRRKLARIGIPFLAALLTGLGVLSISMVVGAGLFGGLIPHTGGLSRSSFGLFNYKLTPTITLPGTSTRTLFTGRNPNCVLPGGWVEYIVAPTDSLFRLSVVYSVSVEALQLANCMGKETLLLPGQVLYVPILPSATASFTPTASRQPTSTPTPSSLPASNTPSSPEGNTPVPPSNTPKAPPATNPPAQKATKAPPSKQEPKPSNTPKPTKEPKATKAPKPTKQPKATKPPPATKAPKAPKPTKHKKSK